MNAHVLVAGIGNLFCSDDGFGPEVVRRLGDQVREDVRVVDYGIRGLHLAYDLLDGYDALVIVDAVPIGEAPGDLGVLRVRPEDVTAVELDAHDMNPVAVLGSLARLGGTLPLTYVVGCRPGSLEEGIGLTEAVTAALSPAVDTVRRLIERLVTELAGDAPYPVLVPRGA